MKIVKRISLLFLSSFVILSLFACESNLQSRNTNFTIAETAPAMFAGAGFSRANSKKMAMADYAEEELAYDSVESGTVSSERKIVKTVNLNTETKTFDESLEWLKNYIKSYDGIIDNSYVDSGNANNRNYNKNANFSVRVPAEKLDSFLSSIGDKLNVTYRQENISDITDEYNDSESKLKSLKIEEESLNAMLKKAKNVEEMIKVEDKLTSVRSEIENITRRIKRFDKQVTYSTVHITVFEVRDLTEPQNINDDFSKETLYKQLIKNYEEAKAFVLRLATNIFTHLPWIALGLAGIIIILIISSIFKALFGHHNDDYVENTHVSKDIKEKETKEDDVEVEIYQEEMQ